MDLTAEILPTQLRERIGGWVDVAARNLAAREDLFVSAWRPLLAQEGEDEDLLYAKAEELHEDGKLFDYEVEVEVEVDEAEVDLLAQAEAPSDEVTQLAMVEPPPPESKPKRSAFDMMERLQALRIVYRGQEPKPRRGQF